MERANTFCLRYNIPMIDAHCHLNFYKFENDVDEVIEDSLSVGITSIVNVGTSLESSEHAIMLAQHHPELYAVVGIHPHHADKIEHGWVEQLERMTAYPKVIAIGEIGMDYYSYQSNGIVDPKIQKKVFVEQIKLAYRMDLPLQIHNRLAGEDVIKILKAHKKYLRDIPGMFHCFAGSMEVLESALGLGFYIGFDGNITYPKRAPGETTYLTDLAKATPFDRLLIETDSPYLAPIPLRGTRNVPKNGIITAQFIAKILNVEYAMLESQVDKNFSTVFGSKL